MLPPNTYSPLFVNHSISLNSSDHTDRVKYWPFCCDSPRIPLFLSTSFTTFGRLIIWLQPLVRGSRLQITPSILVNFHSFLPTSAQQLLPFSTLVSPPRQISNLHSFELCSSNVQVTPFYADIPLEFYTPPHSFRRNTQATSDHTK